MRNFGVIMLMVFLMACKGQSKTQENTVVAVEENTNISEVIKVGAFEQKLNELENYTLIDVRTPEETKEGIIEGALLYNYHDSAFKDSLNTLDKTIPTLVYCRSGGRSGNAAKLMNQLGFKEVYD